MENYKFIIFNYTTVFIVPLYVNFVHAGFISLDLALCKELSNWCKFHIKCNFRRQTAQLVFNGRGLLVLFEIPPTQRFSI